MTERIVADTATTRLINWALGVGSIVTGGLLLWIGSTTQELATQQAVTAERVQTMQAQQQAQTRAVNETASGVRELAGRVQRVEDRLEDARRRDAARDAQQ